MHFWNCCRVALTWVIELFNTMLQYLLLTHHVCVIMVSHCKFIRIGLFVSIHRYSPIANHRNHGSWRTQNYIAQLSLTHIEYMNSYIWYWFYPMCEVNTMILWPNIVSADMKESIAIFEVRNFCIYYVNMTLYIRTLSCKIFSTSSLLNEKLNPDGSRHQKKRKCMCSTNRRTNWKYSWRKLSFHI